MTKFLVDLYASHHPHLVDSITVEAETLEEAARAAGDDPRVQFGTAYAHNAKRLIEEGEPGSENLTLTIQEARALPEPNDNRDYEVGQRIIMVDLPHIGATVREVLAGNIGVGIDYDNDGDLRGAHEAIYVMIRPMPHH